MPASPTAAPTAPATTATTVITPNIVTPTGQTCICVPTGSCQGQGSPDGSGLIDIRIVTNVTVRKTDRVEEMSHTLLAFIEIFKCGSITRKQATLVNYKCIL